MRFIKLIVGFSILLLCSAATAQDKFVVGSGKIEFQLEKDLYYRIGLSKNEKHIDSYNTDKGGEFEFELELNNVYTFLFEKEEYNSQKIVFNTFVPRSVTTSKDFVGFKKFDIVINVDKPEPNNDTIIFKETIALICYNPEIKDFDWDTLYRFEIKRKMNQIQADLMLKYDQEVKLRKAQEVRDRQDAMEEKHVSVVKEKPAQIELERKQQEKEERARLEAIAAKQAKLEAERLIQLELERKEKEAREKAIEDKRLADLEADRKKQEEERVRQEVLVAKQAKVEAERQDRIEIERKEKEAKEKAEEEQRLANLEEERKKREEEERVRQVAFAAKRAKVNAEKQAQLIKKINAREAKDRTKQNSNVEIKGRTILKTKITRNKVTLIYVKVEYTWGGKFFFIEDEPGVFRNISEQFYNLNVKLQVK